MINLGRQQASHGSDALAATKLLLDRRGLRPVKGQPHAARDRLLLVFVVVDHFHAGDAQVNSLRGALGRVWLVQALLRLAAHWASIDDRAFHGAQQAVGELGQSRRGRRMRLHPRAPRAQQQPQNSQRQPYDALRPHRRHAAQHGHQSQRHQHQTGPQVEPVRSRDSGGEETSRVKERHGTLRGSTADGLLGMIGFDFHRAP